MDRHFDEGVAGAALAVVFTAAGAGLLLLTGPTAIFLTPAATGVSTLLLACLGAGVGVERVRLSRRQPAGGLHADYSDTLPG
jgi:putative Mn2+ efflux pump MntP